MDHDRRNLQHVFQEAFTVNDLARPLLSFDTATAAERVRTILQSKKLEVALVRRDGEVAGFLTSDDDHKETCGGSMQPINPLIVVSGSLPLAALVLRLRERSWLLVSVFGEIAGIVGRQDLLQPPARMWLFGIITLLELRFGRMIDEHCPNNSWKLCLSEGRLRKAEALQDERLRCHREVGLIDCLQFADKAQIIARTERLRSLTRFGSKHEVEEVGKRLQTLRNNLAHSQDVIIEDWDTIVTLAENLDSVLEGPVRLHQSSTPPA